MHRTTLALAIAVATLGAQELPSRVGLAAGYVAPQGSWKDSYPSGWNASVQFFFNREGGHEQRLRIDLIGMKEFTETGRIGTVTYTVKATAAGAGLGYDWLPRVGRWSDDGGFHLILVIGGISWAQRVQASARSPYGSSSVDETENGVAISPTAGFQVRFSRYVNLEARYIWSRVTASSNTDLVWEDLNHGIVALGFRY